MWRRLHARLCWRFLAGLTWLAAPASADDPPAEPSRAQKLFDRGRELMSLRQYAEACASFAESEKLETSGGTELNLAFCYESLGKTATAWTTYKRVIERSRRDGRRDREQVARERATLLEPKLARVSVLLAKGADVPGIEVKVDGLLFDRGTWGAVVPVDSGSHVVEAKAPGFKTWTNTFEIEPTAAKKITVPILDVDPLPMPVASAARSGASTEPVPAVSAAAKLPTMPLPVPVPPPSAPPSERAPSGVQPVPPQPVTPQPAANPAPRAWIGKRFLVDALTVEDVKTGLTWQRNMIPRGSPWITAAAYCTGLRVAGSGWRLPTPDELKSILPVNGVAIEPEAFPRTPVGWFWTAHNHPWGAAEAASSATGAQQPVMTDRALFVRCVR